MNETLKHSEQIAAILEDNRHVVDMTKELSDHVRELESRDIVPLMMYMGQIGLYPMLRYDSNRSSNHWTAVIGSGIVSIREDGNDPRTILDSVLGKWQSLSFERATGE